MKLSAVIITFNEERNIGRCLESLQGIADEIVVLDSYSTDKTEEICRNFDVHFVKQKWLGYSEQKNLANAMASYDYILSIDADEALSETLRQSILNEKIKGLKGAYSMNRLVNYCGQWIHHTSWYPDTKIRIWNRNEAKWTGDIHEKLDFCINTSPSLLKGNLLHYTYYTVEEHLNQTDRFTTIAAESLYKKGEKASLFKLLLSPIGAFLKDAVIKKGVLDGRYGLVIAWVSAFSSYTKYKKLRSLWANNHLFVSKLPMQKKE